MPSHRITKVPNGNSRFFFIRIFYRKYTNLDDEDDDNNRVAANENVYANIFVVSAVIVAFNWCKAYSSHSPPVVCANSLNELTELLFFYGEHSPQAIPLFIMDFCVFAQIKFIASTNAIYPVFIYSTANVYVCWMKRVCHKLDNMQ